jgi:hypothetical protein
MHMHSLWLGSAKLRGEGGSVDLPGLPVAIPFEALQADLDVAQDLVRLASGHIQGPLVTASITGTASLSAGALSTWPLDLDVEIEAVDPALRGYLIPLGISVDGTGRAKVRVTGTLGSPSRRYSRTSCRKRKKSSRRTPQRTCGRGSGRCHSPSTTAACCRSRSRTPGVASVSTRCSRRARRGTRRARFSWASS